jgi:hypothetical protein
METKILEVGDIIASKQPESIGQIALVTAMCLDETFSNFVLTCLKESEVMSIANAKDLVFICNIKEE